MNCDWCLWYPDCPPDMLWMESSRDWCTVPKHRINLRLHGRQAHCKLPLKQDCCVAVTWLAWQVLEQKWSTFCREEQGHHSCSQTAHQSMLFYSADSTGHQGVCQDFNLRHRCSSSVDKGLFHSMVWEQCDRAGFDNVPAEWTLFPPPALLLLTLVTLSHLRSACPLLKLISRKKKLSQSCSFEPQTWKIPASLLAPRQKD